MFEVPSDLATFSASDLADLIVAARVDYKKLKDTVTPSTVSDEQLGQLKTLQAFAMVDGPAELAARERRAAEFSALDEKKETEEPTERVEDAKQEVKETLTASSSADVVVPKLSDVIDNKDRKDVVRDLAPSARQGYATLVAAADVPNVAAGSKFDSLLDVAKAFESRSAGFSRSSGGTASGPVHYPVAVLRRDYPVEFSVDGDDGDYAKLVAVADEARLPGGSLLKSADLRRQELEAEGVPNALVAAAGWCAPSETDYSVCLQITTDGLADFPEVLARRGGIRHTTGIEFDTIFGAGTGFFDLTEAQVAAGTVKTCLEIPCPSFVDDRLGVTGLCLTGNILSIRGYPEFTALFTRGALAASAHQINREQIADVVAGSTPINLTGVAPWASDGSVVSQVLSAVEMAALDIKYRLRMQRSATLEVIFPFWLLGQMRADWIRRNGGDYANTLTLADSAINSALSARGVRAQWVYDWQDAFANSAATGMGGDTPVSNLPTTLQFLMYPAGTWVRAVSDVITLNSVYDSTKLATNQVTHLFTETGWAMIKMCPVSRVYTIPICANGSTGVQRAVTC
jgi:hypothetical protein